MLVVWVRWVIDVFGELLCSSFVFWIFGWGGWIVWVASGTRQSAYVLLDYFLGGKWGFEGLRKRCSVVLQSAGVRSEDSVACPEPSFPNPVGSSACCSSLASLGQGMGGWGGSGLPLPFSLSFSFAISSVLFPWYLPSSDLWSPDGGTCCEIADGRFSRHAL